MEKRNNSVRRRVSSIVLVGFIAILLGAPNVKADVIVPGGETWVIDYKVNDDLIIYGTADLSAGVEGELDIYGTANLYDGAYTASCLIYAFPGYAVDEPGSTVNIYGCAPGNILAVLMPADIGAYGLPPVVTVYGSRFRIGTDPASFSPPDDKVINDMLYVLDDSEQELFSLMIWSENIVVHLRAAGSAEKEPIEGELCLSPKFLHRYTRNPVVFATIRLPEGIKTDDVDSDHPLMLSCDDTEGEVKACYQRMFHSCRWRATSRVKIFAFFNMGMMLEGLPDDCEEMQIHVCGWLKSDQKFYGNDSIKILSPPTRHWKHWSHRTSKHRDR